MCKEGQWAQKSPMNLNIKSHLIVSRGRIFETSYELRSSRPYWNCHGMERAMTFGDYVRNFGGLMCA